MLTEPEVRIAARRKAIIMVAATGFSVAAMLVYFFIAGQLRHHPDFVAFTDRHPPAILLLIVPAFPIFLGPVLLAERYCGKLSTKCPACDADVTRRSSEVLATKRCPECEKRIVEGGKPRKRTVFKRSQRWRQWAFLEVWFWIWPIFGAACLIAWLVNPQWFAETPQMLFVPQLIGAGAGGWTFLRTMNRRYVLSFACSSVLLIFGLVVFAGMG